ncbi:hypothetical protein ACIQOU_09145 [Streptomyces sp. NPDC091279]|uniref:hypothetical protein n=1 Tax=Streptomyces sp. NPDC091279 TaxID=3365983 RepID=UPI00381C4368
MRSDVRRRRSEVGCASLCALVFLALTLLIDWDAGSLTAPRALLWAALAGVLLTVLLPVRVRVGPGRLTVRGVWRSRTVRTDALVSIRPYPGVAGRLILYDADGHHLELDTRVLTSSPFLWHDLETAVHHSRRAGTLQDGEAVISRLAHHLDDETTQAVLRVSGLS